MQNSVSAAQLGLDPKCSLEDIELVEKGVHSVWRPAKDDKDYTGGTNNWATLETFAETAERVMR